ncbi:phosphoribosylaminoimidazolesuccinocarboxamide synthase [Serratia marcescens]|uniref:phosphoribosylaminoimidazolesuccinocarboxamide synthase n=1 Tax=Serratia marcescens TaxID=615 RepID=A0A939NPI8_SERMA|nr:phosphoribosylaminoimidazolesuccinocarboxamide synthase [Serratia marcescens]
MVLEFRNDTSALDGQRIEQFDRKGMVNNKFNHFIMSKLEEAGIPTQMERLLSDNEVLVKKLDMVPVECVIRNRAAGSLVKRLGIEEGLELNPPLFDLCSEKRHARSDGQRILLRNLWLGEQETSGAHARAELPRQRRVDPAVRRRGPDPTVDFKLEFGLFNGEVVLGDEFSPDGSRLWDKKHRTRWTKTVSVKAGRPDRSL